MAAPRIRMSPALKRPLMISTAAARKSVRCEAVAITVNEEIRPGPKRLVRDRVHVADDHVGLVSLLEEGVGSPVDRDEHRLEDADVRLDHPQVALVAGPTRDHEGVAIAEARPERREGDPLRKESSLLAEVAHRVLGERLESFRHAASLLGEDPLELSLFEDAAGGDTGAVAVETGAADGEELSFVHVLEQVFCGNVDQPHPAADELERTGVREAPRL